MTRGKAAVILWLVMIAGSIAIIATTRFSADMTAFLPRSPSPAEQILVEQMQNGVASRLILIGLEGAPAPALAELSKAFAQRLRGDSDFVLVNNGEDAGVGASLEADYQLVWQNRYLLSPSVTP